MSTGDEGQRERASAAVRRVMAAVQAEGRGDAILAEELIARCRQAAPDLTPQDIADALATEVTSLAAELARLDADRELLERGVLWLRRREEQDYEGQRQREIQRLLDVINTDDIYQGDPGDGIDDAMHWLGQLHTLLRDFTPVMTAEQILKAAELLRDVADALRARADELYNDLRRGGDDG